jgi:hypothetical protein
MSVGRHARLILQNVTSVEELADVTTDMEVNQKLAAWMVCSETFHIEDHIIENKKFLIATDPIVKVFARHDVINLSKRLLLFLIDLEKNFESNNENEEDYSLSND